MLKRFLLVLAIPLAMVSGCSDSRPATAEEMAVFGKFARKFDESAREHAMRTNAQGDVSIIFDTLPSGVAGECTSGGLGRATVRISRAHWSRMSETGRETLIFHELGHCVLDRDHRNDTVNTPVANRRGGGVPASIMNAANVTDALYERFKTYYLSELFTSSRATVAGNRNASSRGVFSDKNTVHRCLFH